MKILLDAHAKQQLPSPRNIHLFLYCNKSMVQPVLLLQQKYIILINIVYNNMWRLTTQLLSLHSQFLRLWCETSGSAIHLLGLLVDSLNIHKSWSSCLSTLSLGPFLWLLPKKCQLTFIERNLNLVMFCIGHFDLYWLAAPSQVKEKSYWRLDGWLCDE